MLLVLYWFPSLLQRCAGGGREPARLSPWTLELLVAATLGTLHTTHRRHGEAELFQTSIQRIQVPVSL